MEEIFKQLLEGQQQIISEVQGLKKAQQETVQRLDNLEKGQQELKQETSAINDRLSNVEGQLSETNQIVKAIMHGQEVNTAKLDALAINTASKEAVSRIEQEVNSVAEDMSFLLRKTIKHDDDIRQLRKAE